MEANKIQELKLWISEYISKFEEKGMPDEALEYSNLKTAIEFSESKESLNMLNHLYKIRSEIQTHIDENNFDEKYKKLNEKWVYQLNKMVKKIYLLDFIGGANPKTTKRMIIFKADIDFWKEDIESRAS